MPQYCLCSGCSNIQSYLFQKKKKKKYCNLYSAYQLSKTVIEPVDAVFLYWWFFAVDFLFPEIMEVCRYYPDSYLRKIICNTNSMINNLLIGLSWRRYYHWYCWNTSLHIDNCIGDGLILNERNIISIQLKFVTILWASRGISIL